MAGSINIMRGTKMNMAFDQELGKSPVFDLLCTFGGAVDESSFLVSIPLKNGKPLEIDMMQKLLFKYSLGGEQLIVAGYADDVVVEGIRKYWRIRRVQERRQFFERADERYKVALHIEYMQDNWPVNDEGQIEYEEGMTLDISAGGVAMFQNRPFEVGESVFLKLPRVGVGKEGVLPDDAVSVVCWMREAPKGSPYRYVCGYKFKFGADEEKQTMQEYVTFVKNRYHL